MGAIITSDSSKIIVEWNDVANESFGKKSVYNRTDLQRATLAFDESKIFIKMSEGGYYSISIDGSNNTVPIQSINGTTPTNMNHLFELIYSLIL